MSAVSGFLTERLRLARARSGFTSKSEAARALGVGLSTYRAWENGQNGLNVETAIEIAQTFGVRWEWLLAGQGEMVSIEAAEGMAMTATPAPAPATSSLTPVSDVVIQAQHEIEVYENSAGSIVVKMAAGGAFEDQMVVIRPEHVDAIVEALQRLKREALAQ